MCKERKGKSILCVANNPEVGLQDFLYTRCYHGGQRISLKAVHFKGSGGLTYLNINLAVTEKVGHICLKTEQECLHPE